MAAYPVETASGGRLALVRRPSRTAAAEDIAAWRRQGVDLVVSLLEPAEAHELALADEAALCRAEGLDFISFPIADRGLPGSQTATLALVDRLLARLAEGGSVAIHCRASIGRSGLLAASLLVRQGLKTGKAFARISQARGLQCPDTADQIAWVERFEAYLADLPADPFKAAGPASAVPR